MGVELPDGSVGFAMLNIQETCHGGKCLPAATEENSAEVNSMWQHYCRKQETL